MKLFKRFKRWLMAISQTIKDFFNRLCCGDEPPPDPCAGAITYTGIQYLGSNTFRMTGGNSIGGADVWFSVGPPPPGEGESIVFHILLNGTNEFTFPGYNEGGCYTIRTLNRCTQLENVFTHNNCGPCWNFIPHEGITIDGNIITLVGGNNPTQTSWSISDLEGSVLVTGILSAGQNSINWPGYDPDLCYILKFKSDCEDSEHIEQFGNCAPDPCAGFVEHTGVSIEGTTFTLTGGSGTVITAWSVTDKATFDIVAEGVLNPGEYTFEVPGYDPEQCYSVNWKGSCPGADWQTTDVGDCTPEPDPCLGFTPHTNVTFAAGVFTLSGGNGIGDYNYHLENFTANSSQAGTVASKFNYAWNGTDCLLIKWTAVCDGIERNKSFGICTPSLLVCPNIMFENSLPGGPVQFSFQVSTNIPVVTNTDFRVVWIAQNSDMPPGTTTQYEEQVTILAGQSTTGIVVQGLPTGDPAFTSTIIDSYIELISGNVGLGNCNPCSANGLLPGGQKLYAGLFWGQGYVDTTSNQNCSGNNINLPSNTAQLFLAFYTDAALTQPAVTQLNDFALSINHFQLGNVAINHIGNGSTQLAYYLGNFPYEYTEFTGFACEINSDTYPLPVVLPNDCYNIPGSPSLREAGAMNLHRGAGDSTSQGLDASNLPYLVFDYVGAGGSGGGGASIAPGAPGPDAGNSISASYSRIRITNNAGNPLDLLKAYIITLTGKNSTGTGSEILNVPAGNVAEIVSLDRFYVDQDNPLIITIDEQ